MKHTLLALALGMSVLTAPAWAAEPSLHEVYQAANSGRLAEAQHMMTEVLAAHPKSGKAHYVAAEVLARAGKTTEARDELAQAESLAPGLAFASAESVSALRAALTVAPARHALSTAQPANDRHAEAPAGMPAWGWLLAILGLGGFIAWAVTFMRKQAPLSIRPTAQVPSGASATPAGGSWASTTFGNHPASGPEVQPAYGGDVPYRTNPAWQAGAGTSAAPGMGRQILGGLATGVAVGAGVAAGESLVRHWLDGNKPAPSGGEGLSGHHVINQADLAGFEGLDPFPSRRIAADSDLEDFGVADSGNWDDGGSGSSDSDWS